DTYIRYQLNIPLAAPAGLWGIPDPQGDAKPTPSWRSLVQLAICGSESRTLDVEGICDAICGRFAWFKE
ncbi:hypothetical protein DFH06DRAFT_920897, partial [Mycena polygramma]